MNTLGKILLYAAGIFLVYTLVVTFLHVPFMGTGSLFFLLLLACPLMMYMIGGHNHSGHTDEKKVGRTHQH